MILETVLYHRRKDGGIKVWSVKLTHDRVTQSWGVHEKKMQRTVHVVKGNDRQSAILRARHRYERLIEMRERKGYVRSLGQLATGVRVDDNQLNFDALPRHFAPGKPVKQHDMEKLLIWERSGLLSIQRKWDGMRHRIVSNSKGRIQIYSSSNADVTQALLPLIGSLKLPSKTILDVELVAVTHTGHDSFNTVSSVARSLPVRAHRMIRTAMDQRIVVKFIAFDILYEAGQPTYRWSYADRRERLEALLSKSVVEVAQETGSPLAKSIQCVTKYGWEGLVVWRLDQATVVRTNGSPERVNCWKVKLVKEADVVATGFELGKGRNSKVVGKFRIAVRNSRVQSEHHNLAFTPMGKCGGGLDDATREAALSWTYPCVIQIEYDSKSDKGFRFPTFIRKREDKAVTEC